MEPYEEPQTRIEFMPLSILRALWKRGILIALSWVLISIVGAAVIYSLPAVYQARTIILIERQRIPERYVVSTVNEDLSNRLNRISQQILSYEPLLRLIEEFGLYEDLKGRLVQEEIVQKMRNDIKVSLIEGWTETSAPAFQIVFEGEDPNVVAQVTNRLATLFIDENLRTRANQALGTTEFLTNQLEEYRQDVERQESLMTDYRTRNSGELPEQRSVLIAELSRLEREAQGAQDDIQRAHQNRMMIESSIGSAKGTLEMLQRMADEQAKGAMRRADGSVALGVDQSVIDLRRGEDELMMLEARYSDNHPDVLRGRAAVERLRKIAEQNQNNPVPASAAPDATSSGAAGDESSLSMLVDGNFAQSIVRERERIDNLQAQVELANQQIKAAEARRAAVMARMNQIDSRLGRMPLHEQELAKVNRDYEISMENYKSLLEKRIEAELASEMETRQKAEKFSVLDAARLPEKPVRPDRVLLLAITVGAGLFASCLIGFGVELKNNVLLGEWELPPSVSLLGQVPFIQFDPHGGGESTSAESGGARRSRFPRLAWAAASLLLVLAVAAGASLYFGWLSI
jgi:polysaccharide chain length determinant protein (PEP-CTERM system associated)